MIIVTIAIYFKTAEEKNFIGMFFNTFTLKIFKIGEIPIRYFPLYYAISEPGLMFFSGETKHAFPSLSSAKSIIP